MDEEEISWDRLLKIRTTGRDDSHADQYHYPYEPTPYPVLQRLADSGWIGKKQMLLDYGCGKGRVDFYLSYQTKCRSTGIEYDQRLYEAAQSNRNTAASAGRITFCHNDAAEYIVPQEADRFYFFNPFSVEILKRVLTRILDSYYECPREMLLFFYYPSDEYIACLMWEDAFSFCDEISCQDLFSGENVRERILIFEKQNK